YGRSHLGDIANLRSQVAGHGVDRISKVAPHTADAFYDRLAAELSFGADFARHARHFRCKGAELVHHRIDGVFQHQDFAAHVHRDLARQIAIGDGSGHFRDVAHLCGEVAGHEVNRVRQILPHAAHTLYDSLSAEL